MIKQNKNLLWLLVLTVVLMVPGYLIRCTSAVYMFLFTRFSTYPGDLWNFFENYLKKGAVYPPEYPAGLRFFYEIMQFNTYESYTVFFSINLLILTLFALGTTYLLFKILKETAHKNGIFLNTRSIFLYWILAPSFIFYGSVNYDLPVVFLIVLAVYLFTKEKYYVSVGTLALGTVLKVFPIFLLPLFIWKAPRKLRIYLTVLFGGVVLALNLPYMISNFQTWIFPYIWQISSNITTGPDQGTYWWILYPFLGKLTGWTSLALFGALSVFVCLRMKKATFFELCLAIILLFLLTDRIYSPQYNLYLLPFLVLATYPISKKAFYSMDILNVCIVFFCFYLKLNPLYLQLLVFMRYGLLIYMLRSLYVRTSR